jgi:hypothetical protein
MTTFRRTLIKSAVLGLSAPLMALSAQAATVTIS